MRGSNVRGGLYEGFHYIGMAFMRGSTVRGGLYEGFRCEGWLL